MKMRCARRRDEGSVLMEFILVMPILFFLIFGLIQFSLIWMARLMTHYAAYSAARAAIVYPEDDRPSVSYDDSDKEKSVAFLAAKVALAKSWIPGLETWYGIEGRYPELIGNRLEVDCEDLPDFKAVKATVRFRYPLMIPYAGSIIAYMAQGFRARGKWYPTGYEPEDTGKIKEGVQFDDFHFIELEESCIMPYLWNTELLPRADSDLPKGS